MLFIKYLLNFTGGMMLLTAAAIVTYNLYHQYQFRKLALPPVPDGEPPSPRQVDWLWAKRLAIFAWVPLLFSASIVVIPAGTAGVRISQLSGTRPGSLDAGLHFVKPGIEKVQLFDVRDQVLSTAARYEAGKNDLVNTRTDLQRKPELFTVQSKEGLTMGMAITVRYRLDKKRLGYIQANLPQPVEEELVPPVVSSVFREIIPNYSVREVFSLKREEVRRLATEQITSKLAGDGIIVKEVMLRDISLPGEYAKGLDTLLLQEQQNEGLTYETEMKLKQVRIAELEAEAAKIRNIKNAEGNAQVHVIQAKAESDAMTYTLPLKEKQIQQTKLEAEARKESTLKNAEAMAQAKIIDSKAELERRNYLAEAEAKRIRVVAAADTERMRGEAVLLKQNPLLINKIIAERLSDKLQIMMVPSDGKFFFNDVLKASNPAGMVAQAEEAEESADSGDANGNHNGYASARKKR